MHMEETIAFAATVVLISVSGVMSPGPLFATNIVYGIRGGLRAGIKMAYGHTVVELPLIILLGVGIISLESFPQFRVAISVLGALGLFAFAGLQIKGAMRPRQVQAQRAGHGPFLAGMMLTALNPFFIIWWLTIGTKLILDAMEMWSVAGLAIMFGFHIWMDYVWMGTVGFLAKKGSGWMSDRVHRAVLVALSGMLIYFGIIFAAEGLATI